MNDARKAAWQILQEQRARRDRQHATSTFDGSSDGRFVPARPLDASGGFGGLPGSPVGPAVQGEVCSLKATSVAVSTTPTVVEFTATVGEQAWAAELTLPTSEVVPNFPDAYYDIQVEIDRGAFTGTVEVEVLRGDTVVWDKTMSPYWADPKVPVTAKGRLTKDA